MARLILTPSDAKLLAKLGADGEKIWQLAEQHDAWGMALTFIRAGRTAREFSDCLRINKQQDQALRPKRRWSVEPY
jgi:hypothetical protein